MRIGQMLFLSYFKIRKVIKIWTISMAAFLFITILIFKNHETSDRGIPRPWVPPDLLKRFEQELKRSRFANFDNEVGTQNGELIVPNIVHFVVFENPFIGFIHFICILAAMRNQRPEKMYFHTNLDTFEGEYWTRLMNLKQFRDILVIKKTEMPTEIFNQTIKPEWRVFHGGDVARMLILMEYGGIYLDTDSYIVRSLDIFRKFEMTLGWRKNVNQSYGNMVILAHKEARFLRLWYYSYDGLYDTNEWYYNAAHLPTELVLDRRPDFVHAVESLFCHDLCVYKVFQEYLPDWKKYYAFHLLARHFGFLHNISEIATYPVVFNEFNLQNYPITFREMANEVLDYEKALKLAKFAP